MTPPPRKGKVVVTALDTDNSAQCTPIFHEMVHGLVTLPETPMFAELMADGVGAKAEWMGVTVTVDHIPPDATWVELSCERGGEKWRVRLEPDVRP